MSMTDEVQRIPHKKRAWVIQQLGDEGPEFEALLADPGVSSVDLARALARRGIHIPPRTVYEWACKARA